MAPTIALQFENIPVPYVETQGEVRTLHMPVPKTQEEIQRSMQYFQRVALEFDRELSEDAGTATVAMENVMTAVVEGAPVKEAIAKTEEAIGKTVTVKAIETCDGKYIGTEIIWKPEKAQKENSSTAQSSTQNFDGGREPTQQAESSTLNSLD